jgi:hypothetical protein
LPKFGPVLGRAEVVRLALPMRTIAGVAGS